MGFVVAGYVSMCLLSMGALLWLSEKGVRLIWKEVQLIVAPFQLAIEITWLLIRPESTRKR